ncbi:MAG: methyltransferase domain-containing protein [Elusimicrobia bacterium]|nr:methyltransferase domain-containing protein [Elusimicrobiota bacterium]
MLRRLTVAGLAALLLSPAYGGMTLRPAAQATGVPVVSLSAVVAAPTLRSENPGEPAPVSPAPTLAVPTPTAADPAPTAVASAETLAAAEAESGPPPSDFDASGGGNAAGPATPALLFLTQVARNWKTIGAVAPSSPALARRMIESADVARAHHVLELGPGTGVFTAEIDRARPSESRYLGLEANARFASVLRPRFPGLRFEHAQAQTFDLNAYVAKHGPFDAVISGLPWTAFPPSLQRSILDNVLPHLASGGRFVSFAYWGLNRLPAGRRFYQLLADRLPGVGSSRIVWANLPPALVYTGLRQP